MGVHIDIKRYDPGSVEIGDSSVDWWDCVRYSGDTEIAHSKQVDWEFFDRGDCDSWVTYQRPKDWSQLETAVESFVPESNKPRWREAIRRMKADSSLWFEIS